MGVGAGCAAFTPEAALPAPTPVLHAACTLRPQAVRGIVSGALVGPALPSVLAILQARPGSSASGAAGQAPLQGKASAALLRLVAASLEVLATELGSEAVEQLLGALVQIFGAAGGRGGHGVGCREEGRAARLLLHLLAQRQPMLASHASREA